MSVQRKGQGARKPGSRSASPARAAAARLLATLLRRAAGRAEHPRSVRRAGRSFVRVFPAISDEVVMLALLLGLFAILGSVLFARFELGSAGADSEEAAVSDDFGSFWRSFNTLFMTITTFLSLLTLSPFKINTSLLTMITTFITLNFIIPSANGTPSLNKSLFTNLSSLCFIIKLIN